MWRFRVVLSEVGNAVNHHNYITVLRIAVIPFIRRHQGSGCYLLWMDLESARYTNNTLTFLQQQGFIPKLYPQGCKPTMDCLAPADRILTHAQKGFLRWRMGGNFNPSTEAENQVGLANSRSDDLLQHSQSLFSSLRVRWLLGGLWLGIEPRPIKH